MNLPLACAIAVILAFQWLLSVSITITPRIYPSGYTMWLSSKTHVLCELVLCLIEFIKYCVGEKLGKILALFPTMYLSGGTCVTLIMIGGSSMKIFFQTVCASNSHITTLSTIEWYIVFTVSAIVLAQLPNLNSIAGISLVGSISAVTYCTLTWVISVVKERPQGVSFEPVENTSDVATICTILNALGMIVFAFRGHNLVLEIQVCILTNQFYNFNLLYVIKVLFFKQWLVVS